MKKNDTIAPFSLFAIPDEGEMLASFVERYVGAICERVLPSLALKTEEKQSLISLDLKHHEEKRQGFSGGSIGIEEYEEFPGLDDSFGMSLDATKYVEMEFNILTTHILGLSFAGLFHVFERQLMTVLHLLELMTVLHLLDHRCKNTIFDKIPEKERHTFLGYKKLLEKINYPICGSIETDIEKLRLIANVMKHGSVKSLQKLKDKFPDLFMGGISVVSSDDMLLTTDLLLEISKSISVFWRNFPKNDI